MCKWTLWDIRTPTKQLICKITPGTASILFFESPDKGSECLSRSMGEVDRDPVETLTTPTGRWLKPKYSYQNWPLTGRQRIPHCFSFCCWRASVNRPRNIMVAKVHPFVFNGLLCRSWERIIRAESHTIGFSLKSNSHDGKIISTHAAVVGNCRDITAKNVMEAPKDSTESIKRYTPGPR